MLRTIILVSFLVLICKTAELQVKKSGTLNNQTDTLNEKKDFLVAFPLLFYTPETKWGIGLGGVYNFYLKDSDEISPSSQLQLLSSYTQRKQILFNLPFKLYWNEFKHVVEGEFGYYDYVYPFFGEGIEARESALEQYDQSFFRFQLDALKQVRTNTYVGIRYWLDNPKIKARTESGLLESSDLLGKTGGTISGLGPQVRFDSRDNIYFPTDGYYANAVFQSFDKALGSDFNFNRTRFDLRAYKKVNKSVIAAQLYSDVNFGDVPFFQKSRIGGPRRLRGYLEGRWIDNAMITPQVEARIPLHGIQKRIGIIGFFSTGTVAPTFTDLFSSEWKYSYGTGFRYTMDLDKGINVRIDYAFTPEGSNFYLTIGESF